MINKYNYIYRKFYKYEYKNLYNKFINFNYDYNNFYEWFDNILNTITPCFYNFVFFIDNTDYLKKMTIDMNIDTNIGIIKYNSINNIISLFYKYGDILYESEFTTKIDFKIILIKRIEKNIYNNCDIKYLLYFKDNNISAINNITFKEHINNYNLNNLDFILIYKMLIF